LLILLLPVSVMTTVAFVATASLRRANRLVPTRTTSSPPLRWLWSPSEAATLHRRLRSVCQLLDSLSRPPAPTRRWRRHKVPPLDRIAELAREVLEEAVVLDRQIVSASCLARGVTRGQALAMLDYEVRAVEDAARRVHQLATRRARLSNPPMPGELSLDQRIAAMEAALAELGPRPPLA
jgi:hypothetical protein